MTACSNFQAEQSYEADDTQKADDQVDPTDDQPSRFQGNAAQKPFHCTAHVSFKILCFSLIQHTNQNEQTFVAACRF